ncbi:aromatic compound dioxygenase [Pleomassaria siparia CBS 279.74]|uniref:Aromatic compound dioxygenase n=1 Tax=Pleomassaria siparia CBS 279.74 TaxID=1314801 RepID=A0A6G1JVS7_9PLEO|nr:aromatic compound dioxygenase [Pleomassaria siparia CBS 279.74]
MVRFTALVAAALTVLTVFAHPGHSVEEEAAERAAYRRSLDYQTLAPCAAEIKARDHKMVQRRMEQVRQLQERHGLERRSLTDVLNKDHKSTKAVTPSSPAADIFGSNSSCILQPETTEGPYYVSGELVRKDITDGQKGVPLTFDVQIIDTNTCKPISDVALEAWYANSTGVYGGVTASGNGNSGDQTNLDNPMLRGIQFSDADGIVQFSGVFPGHYTGRTAHIHVLSHHNVVTSDKSYGTIVTGGTISHVGQLFFDQSLITSVEQLSPYSTNRQTLTTNAQDGILAGEAATTDPVLNYVLLGSTVADGIFGWVTVGINSKTSKTVKAAANYDPTD